MRIMIKTLSLVVAGCLSCCSNAAATSATCVNEPAERINCYPSIDTFPEPTEELCLAQGCCWNSLNSEGIPCALAEETSPRSEKCDISAKSSRLACRNPRFASPELLENPDACELAGCCYEEGECFQPLSDGYELLTLDETSNGWRGTLALRHGSRGPFGNDVPLLELQVDRTSASEVRIRITDPAFPRYEVPDLPLRRKEHDKKNETDYEVHFTLWPFGVAVTRRDSGEVLFNSTPPMERKKQFSGLVFENQYLEISTQLAESKDKPTLYGLGERLAPTRLEVDHEGDRYSLFTRAPNASAPRHNQLGGDNLYGVHPFVLQLEDGEAGKAHGIFVLSSNAMEVVARRDALTYRLTGGILDIFVFSGPSPQEVLKQYTDVVGRPAMPPYWALGYHVGQREVSFNGASQVVMQLRQAGIPMEAYWHDSELLAENVGDSSHSSVQEAQTFIDDLHFHTQYFVCVQFPAIIVKNERNTRKHRHNKSDSGYSDRDNSLNDGEEDVYQFNQDQSDSVERHGSHSDYGSDSCTASCAGCSGSSESDSQTWDPIARGEELDVFVKGVNGERYAQKAFLSGWAVFVDFFHPEASRYWHEQLAKFHQYGLSFDGLWLDMNEPSSTCDCAFVGEDNLCARVCSIDPKQLLTVEKTDVQNDGGFIRTSDVNFPFDPYRQPFAPGQSDSKNGGHGNLNSATLPMAALHYSSLHYNLHSLYGHVQARATYDALNSITNKRSVLLSRSTFSGSGRYAGHWVGDDGKASWEQLRLSISGTLQMNLLGVPLTGPNVCGSHGESSTELCVRWHQAASLLPLIRNHAEKGTGKQLPVDFDADSLNILRSVLLQRYRYLPYMYTLFYEAHRSGSPVVRPLSFEFPNDKTARSVEYQYLVGPALMVSPVVHRGAISAEVYFPKAFWYDAHNGKLVLDPEVAKDNRRVSLLTPLAKLQVHLRGGYIVPTQQALTTTALSRRGAFTLLAALDTSHENPFAFGQLYVDDGDSLSAIQEKRYSLVEFSVVQNTTNSIELKSSLVLHGYAGPEMQADLNDIRVYGVRGNSFAANSSMEVKLISLSNTSSHDHAIKADYFAQSDMLVLSRFGMLIGQEFHIKVTAQPAKTAETGEGDKSVGANTSGKSGGSEGETSKGSGQSSRKKFSILSIVGIVIGCIFLAAIILVSCIRRRRRGYEII